MDFINAFFSLVAGILGNIVADWLQPKLENWKKLTVSVFVILVMYLLIIPLYQKKEETQKQPETTKNQTIQDNHGTINNIESQKTINNYAPQKPDNKEVVKKEKQNIEEVFLEIPIRLDNKSKGYSKIFIEGKEAIILSNSLPNNPWISIKSIPNKNQEIMIITNNGDTCFIKNVFDKKDKDQFPINFIPKCN